MVKVGFICEGETELIILESQSFKYFLSSIGIEFVKAINAYGNGNLLPKHIVAYTKILMDDGCEKIMVLTDLDEDRCVTITKQRVDPNNDYSTVIAVKNIESWFLADSATLSSLFKEKFIYEFPEKESSPREVLNKFFLDKTGRGIGPSKPLFAQKMLGYGFSVSNAAVHKNCKSARYLIEKLKSITH